MKAAGAEVGGMRGTRKPLIHGAIYWERSGLYLYTHLANTVSGGAGKGAGRRCDDGEQSGCRYSDLHSPLIDVVSQRLMCDVG